MTGKGEMIKTEKNAKIEQNPATAELIQYLKEKDLRIEALIEEKLEWKKSSNWNKKRMSK